jgi:glucosamine--fructose-6-phosphate aminotransferase (isomerizing)
LADSLTVQSAMAMGFIDDQWSIARHEADRLLSPHADTIKRVIICGCGDSFHASLSAQMAFSAWSSRACQSVSAMNAARYTLPALPGGADCLVIGISASGEVARTREALGLAGKAGMQTLAITVNAESSLARESQLSLSLAMPPFPEGPGLLSFLASLLMCYASALALSGEDVQREVDATVARLLERLERWIAEEAAAGAEFAHLTSKGPPVLFMGSGPAYGMALFSAAKLAEAAGVLSWGEDVEEWSHIEYFCEPAASPLWLLSAHGRAASREIEIEEAAKCIGRRLLVSRWMGSPADNPGDREALAPLALWAGPAAYASHLATALGEVPFRGFAGGRSREEGGGASRIRSSWRETILRGLRDESSQAE